MMSSYFINNIQPNHGRLLILNAGPCNKLFKFGSLSAGMGMKHQQRGCLSLVKHGYCVHLKMGTTYPQNGHLNSELIELVFAGKILTGNHSFTHPI